APLPPGADAVVMQEDTQASGDDGVLIGEPVKPWENVRFCGEDVKRGTTVIDRGQPLTAAKLGLIAALGIPSVAVGRRPTVGLIATGTELIEPGESRVEGQIYESNRTTLRPLLTPAGADCRVYPLVPDSMEATTAALEKALGECDAVVTSGGVSVGELDFVKAAFEALGGRLEFWKVAIRPGKPFVFGRWCDRFLFGLPGNPVSALVTAFLLVRPAILRWQGALHTEPHVTWGILDEALANPGDRRHFVRVQVTESGRIRSAGLQASHVLASLARADGLVDVPAGATLMAGTPVAVMRLA
ncbi:MAG TPA: molybdopterin molybdotransferase MoeA, partial [Verrucomicrobiae bacterium]|nr:molybdopterin molybdotransferase MoeA [Verrucomicrobiae bacterium]